MEVDKWVRRGKREQGGGGGGQEGNERTRRTRQEGWGIGGVRTWKGGAERENIKEEVGEVRRGMREHEGRGRRGGGLGVGG